MLLVKRVMWWFFYLRTGGFEILDRPKSAKSCRFNVMFGDLEA